MLDRRRFLQSTFAAGAAFFLPEMSQVLKAYPAAESQLGKVKITGIKTASVMIKYPAHLVKVETDSGLYGIGDAISSSVCASEASTAGWRVTGLDVAG